jgi:hypothetical protein
VQNQGFNLSEQQMGFFRTFGYLSFPELMADRIEEIDREFEAVWAAHGGGHNGRPHNEKARSCIVPFIDQSEVLCSLLDDPRILGIAYSILGDDFNYTGSDGNFYVGETGWHSDGARKPEDPIHIKIAFYLDPLTRDIGALRVIPGSHHFGDGYADTLSHEIRNSQELWGLHGRDIPAAILETQPGDLVMFNHNTKHAAFGGSIRRRMFTINLSQRYPENRLEDLRKQIATASRFWIDRKYGEKMVRSASTERMRHLEQNIANDGHLAELSRQARERMSEPSRG